MESNCHKTDRLEQRMPTSLMYDYYFILCYLVLFNLFYQVQSFNQSLDEIEEAHLRNITAIQTQYQVTSSISLNPLL